MLKQILYGGRDATNKFSEIIKKINKILEVLK